MATESTHTLKINATLNTSGIESQLNSLNASGNRGFSGNMSFNKLEQTISKLDRTLNNLQKNIETQQKRDRLNSIGGSSGLGIDLKKLLGGVVLNQMFGTATRLQYAMGNKDIGDLLTLIKNTGTGVLAGAWAGTKVGAAMTGNPYLAAITGLAGGFYGGALEYKTTQLEQDKLQQEFNKREQTKISTLLNGLSIEKEIQSIQGKNRLTQPLGISELQKKKETNDKLISFYTGYSSQYQDELKRYAAKNDFKNAEITVEKINNVQTLIGNLEKLNSAIVNEINNRKSYVDELDDLKYKLNLSNGSISDIVLKSLQGKDKQSTIEKLSDATLQEQLSYFKEMRDKIEFGINEKTGKLDQNTLQGVINDLNKALKSDDIENIQYYFEKLKRKLEGHDFIQSNIDKYMEEQKKREEFKKDKSSLYRSLFLEDLGFNAKHSTRDELKIMFDELENKREKTLDALFGSKNKIEFDKEQSNLEFIDAQRQIIYSALEKFHKDNTTYTMPDILTDLAHMGGYMNQLEANMVNGENNPMQLQKKANDTLDKIEFNTRISNKYSQYE